MNEKREKKENSPRPDWYREEWLFGQTDPAGLALEAKRNLDGHRISMFPIPFLFHAFSDAPWDRRALFSNSAGSSGDEVLHQNMGTYGYGYRLDIPVEHKDLQLALERGYFYR